MVCPLRRIPRPFEDALPAYEDANNLNIVDTPPAQHAPSKIRRVLLTLRDTLQTNFNSYGLSRLYPRRPSFEPDKFVSSSLLSKMCPTIASEDDLPDISPPPYPFPNMTIYRLMSWMNSGSNKKSKVEVTRLIQKVMLADDFDSRHLDGFSVKKSLCEMDGVPGKETQVKFPDDWREASVTINIPMKLRESEPIPFSVPGFHFRPLTQVIRSAFADIQGSAFYLSPFKRIWKDPLDSHQERIFDELYTSDSWLNAQEELQKLPKEPRCSLERVIAGLMFFSDATHLANFGTAKAWPLYMYFGNLTKYARSAPKSGACHLVGFLPSVSVPPLIALKSL